MTTSDTEQKKQWALQSRLYDLAKRKGLRLEKYRKLNSKDPDYKTFRILNRTSGQVVHAARPGGYGLTLEQVEEYLNRQGAKMAAATTQPSGPTGGFKGTDEPTKSVEQAPSVPVSGAGIQASMFQTKPEGVITIADSTIPSYIESIYTLMKLWSREATRDRPGTPPTREELLELGPYYDAWKTVCECSQSQKSLYMFAHLLGAAKKR